VQHVKQSSHYPHNALLSHTHNPESASK
jgi:hypothetical protein